MSQSGLTDMTSGPIAPQIIRYTMPLIVGNFCLLTYNATDSIIVGRFVGPHALAALGAAGPVMNIMLFLIVGICLGMSVLMGSYFGAGDMGTLKREISTSIIAGGVFTLVIVAGGLLFSRDILRLMHTPPEILDDGTRYLQIIFFGLLFTFVYNIYASTLRSMGNSNASLWFLVVSAVLNVLMDLWFVVGLKLGVAGAAWATVIAEAFSALFCIVYVYRRIPLLRFRRHEFVFDRQLFRSTVSYSSVAAMQQITLHIGKLLIQGAVNPLGVSAIAAFNAVSRIDDFVMIAQQNIAHGTTGFIAQNHGGEKPDRVRRGFHIGLRIEIVYTLVISLLIYLAQRSLVWLFVGNEGQAVVGQGLHYLRVMVWLYLLPALTNILQGYFRGIGRMRITLYSTFVQIVGRVIAAYLLATYFGVAGIALACLAGWICMLAYELPLFRKEWRRMTKSRDH